MLKLVFFHFQAHLNAFLQILEYFSQSVEVDGFESLGVYRLWVVRLCGVYFCTLCPSIGSKERSRQALDRLPLVSNRLTNFWMQHFDGARLSRNSVRNAVWRALNEPVCQYLRKRNPCCSTVYIDNSLGPLARESPCICFGQSLLICLAILGSKSGKINGHSPRRSICVSASNFSTIPPQKFTEQDWKQGASWLPYRYL